MELALGLPVYINSFIDKVPRRCYPYKLNNLSVMNLYLSTLDNFKYEEMTQEQAVVLTYFLSDSFKECELEDVLKNINSENYSELISDIKYVSGITDSNGEIDIHKSQSSLSWHKSINAIQAYTSNTYKDICEMTLRQFNQTLDFIGIVVNWEYKTIMLPHVQDGDKFISDGEHPLASDIRNSTGQKRMTMKDMNSFMTDFKK